MGILDYQVALFFSKVSVYNILNDCGLRTDGGKTVISYDNFGADVFRTLIRHELPNVSEDEAEHMVCYWCNSQARGSAKNGLNVFDVLRHVAENYLQIKNNCPIVSYDKIIEWRELVEYVGEDLLVCAFLSAEAEKRGHEWKNFAWNPVIGHDNVQLNCIMQKGISDNHFHLFGSSPYFRMVWLRLMTDFSDERYVTALQEMDKDRRIANTHYASYYKEESLVRMRFQAAIIRRHLAEYVIHKRAKDTYDEENAQNETMRKLSTTSNYYEYYADMETWIESRRLWQVLVNQAYTEDYFGGDFIESGLNAEFAGERYLIYQMLRGEINGEKIPPLLLNWFYAYLVIKIKFRREFLQVNQKVGFENFSRYNSRKVDFLNKKLDVERMVKHAVGGSLYTGNIRSLELRITPEKTAKQNKRYIQKCDFYIEHNLGKRALEQTYYVFHFPKKRDEDVRDGLCEFVKFSRHFSYRQKLEYLSDEIITFRERYPEQAQRVLGIDACAQELYCRPEVFAPAFRKLTTHVAPFGWRDAVPQLNITYHVGEDWHDVVDGLRAIDEAISFLNMCNGMRMGHATVLGIDIEDWYTKKYQDVWISKQDYLDNVVWLYHKLMEFDIRGCESLKGWLRAEYEQYFQEVFDESVTNSSGLYTINTYYLSWRLRGDEPSIYLTGEYVRPNPFQAYYYLNEKVQDGLFIRNKSNVTRLVYAYHYSASVRKKGAESICKHVSETYIAGVIKVQKAMQKYVADCGIGVETNPSSNYKISTMDKYEMHPILKFYNMGLTWNENELNDCPQIHASVNTDDKGVFDTALENEFALLGSAVEHMKDAEGKAVYRKQQVYDWLDRIRENGNQQSFQARRESNWHV